MPRDPAYLLDILEAARRVQEGVAGIAKEKFLNEWMRHSAIVRQIEIIGEASKRLSDEFRDSHSDIPWRRMAGMRDVVIHRYDDFDLNEIWKVAIEDIPKLISAIEKLIPPEDESGEGNQPEE
jgi:uncharacterized protein with HEPN domain